MKRFFVLALLAGFIFILSACPDKAPGSGQGCGCDTPANNTCRAFPDGRCGWCADKGCDTGMLCSYLPRDVDFKQLLNGYAEFNSICQKAFDWFSWQSFVALNWPADSLGKPLNTPIGSNPQAPRVWESFFTPGEIFNPAISSHKGGMLVLGQKTKVDPHVFNGGFQDLEAVSNKPLIDRNLNFTLYEVRVNKDEVDYIRKNGLTSYCGQKRFYDSVSQQVNFPSGSYKSDSVGSIELKLAWRILLPGDNASRYFTRPAIIVVPPGEVSGNQPIRDTVLVGLVGMHLIRKVSTDGSSFIWSSFEQIDNAPDCPDGKCPPNMGQYSYYNPGCTSCVLNGPPTAPNNNFMWSASLGKNNPQYARLYANGGKFGTQVGRIYPVRPSTDSISRQWQQKLQGTVWQYYRLIGSQWLNAEDSRGPADMLGIPREQANSVQETYMQKLDSKTGSGSCMNCHGDARGSYNLLLANQSFLLSFPRQDSAGCLTGKK